MEKSNKKSMVIFNMEFTTSKFLSYLVILSSSILGYLLTSVEIVIVGLIVGASLSGVKNITESYLNLKSKILPKKDNDENTENTENKKEVLL